MKVAAIECLCLERDNISYLLEQASAKAQEVRQAAYRALSSHDDDSVIAVLQKAFDGKDLTIAADSLRRCQSEKLLKFVRSRIDEELAELPKTKEKKGISAKVGRLTQMLECLRGRDDSASETLIMKIFAARADLAKVKGATLSGADLNSAVARLLAEGTPPMTAALVASHAELDHGDLTVCFAAARRSAPADRVFTIFSPYLSAASGKKGVATDKRGAIVGQLGYYRDPWSAANAGPLDPRWLDTAVAIRDIDLVVSLIRPGHADANRFLSEAFAEKIKSSKYPHDCQGVVAAMARGQHPEATDAAIALIEKFNDKIGYFGYYLGHFIGDLPKSALPRLEALIPKLSDRIADVLLVYIQQLRDKP